MEFRSMLRRLAVILFPIGLLLFYLSFALVFFPGIFPNSILIWLETAGVNTVALMAVSLMLIAFRIVFFPRYARITSSFFDSLVGVDQSTSQDSDVLSEIRTEIRDLKRSWTSKDINLTDAVQEEILELYRRALEDKFTHDISGQIRLLVTEQFKREVEFEASRFLSDVNSRLQAASSTVTVRGFLNLILGIGFAGGSLYVLQQAIQLLTPDRLNSMPLSTVLYLTGTRISLALVITLVAYFFLSLYKKSLDDAKFYQNEMTDISSKAAALQLAYFQGDKEARTFVLSRLMESDRNRSLNVASMGQSNDNLGAEITKKLIDKLPALRAS